MCRALCKFDLGAAAETSKSTLLPGREEYRVGGEAAQVGIPLRGKELPLALPIGEAIIAAMSKMLRHNVRLRLLKDEITVSMCNRLYP